MLRTIMPLKVKQSKTGWSTEREWISLCVVTILSLTLRVYLIRFHPFVNYDGAYYINYFHDGAWQDVFHPGYPLFIELFRLVCSDGVVAAQMVSVIFGSILAVPFYFLARCFMRPTSALVATIIVMLNPLMIRYGLLPMSDVQYIFFELVAFLFFIQRRPLLFGLASGIGYLTRPEALVLYSALVLIDLFKNRQWKFIGIAVSGFVICALPYILYLKVETGTWTLSPKTVNLREWETNWRLNIKLESGKVTDTPLSERFVESIKGYPVRIGNYIEQLSTFGGIPLCILGIIGLIRARNILLAGMVMFLILPIFGLTTSARFVLPYIPFLGMFSILALENFHSRLFRISGVLAVLIAYFPIVSSVTQPDDSVTEFYVTGMAMRPVTQLEDIFLDRKPYVAFYAGGRYVQIPNDPIDSILAFARRTRAKYLVVSGSVIRNYRPQLTYLLYSDSTINRFHLRTTYLTGLSTGNGVRVLEILR